MTIREIITRLVNSEDYTSTRIFYNDEIIDFIKKNLPSDYSYFAEKETAYRKLKGEFKNVKE